MKGLMENIDGAVAYIKSKVDSKPTIGIILGTGLGKFAEGISQKKVLDYSEIPHFVLPTVEAHSGKLVFGKVGDKNIVAMEGRFHYYEGYSMQEITFPVRVMKGLGVEILIVSNAGGGMNPDFELGEIVIINDHINLLPDNPLRGLNDNRLGIRFPDMSEPYDRKLIKLAEEAASQEKIRVKKGVLTAVSGPNLETAAEYRFLRMIGADMVCMSTVPEVIVAVHAGLRVFGVTVITDRCIPDSLKPANLQEILKIAREAEPKLAKFLARFIKAVK